MYQIAVTSQFKKDYKTCLKRNYNIYLLDQLIFELESKGIIPRANKPHQLKGNFKKHWECHILADWLLIWMPDHEAKVIKLVRTGTHTDIF